MEMMTFRMGEAVGKLPVTSLPDADHHALISMAASEKGVSARDICQVCLDVIQVMSFRGTGVCSEVHRKLRDGEPTDKFRAIAP